MLEDRELIMAWLLAAEDLAIEVVSPVTVNGVSFPVHVPGFGRPKGAVPVFLGDTRSRHDVEAAGYFVSLLNPAIYREYDRAVFIETLVDWGWNGPADQVPTWYANAVENHRTR